MTTRKHETPPIAYARIAGLLYLLIIVSGIFAEVAVRTGLIVKGDPSATAANVLASQPMFRAGFVADSVMLLSDVAIAVLFYALLRPVSKVLALTAASFRLAQAAVLGFNLLNYYAPMILLTRPEYTNAFEPRQLNALAAFFFDLQAHGYDLGLLFFGASCLVLGWLVIRSWYFPRIFGYGLVAAGLVYLAGSLTRFISPGLLEVIAPIYIVPLIAELAFCLWLLVRGIRVRPNQGLKES